MYTFFYRFKHHYDQSIIEKDSAKITMELKWEERVVCLNTQLAYLLKGTGLVDCQKARVLLMQNEVYLASKKALDDVMEYFYEIWTIVKYFVYLILFLLALVIALFIFYILRFWIFNLFEMNLNVKDHHQSTGYGRRAYSCNKNKQEQIDVADYFLQRISNVFASKMKPDDKNIKIQKLD